MVKVEMFGSVQSANRNHTHYHELRRARLSSLRHNALLQEPSQIQMTFHATSAGL